MEEPICGALFYCVNSEDRTEEKERESVPLRDNSRKATWPIDQAHSHPNREYFSMYQLAEESWMAKNNGREIR